MPASCAIARAVESIATANQVLVLASTEVLGEPSRPDNRRCHRPPCRPLRRFGLGSLQSRDPDAGRQTPRTKHAPLRPALSLLWSPLPPERVNPRTCPPPS